ncbi:MAG: S41 family peptidase [Archangium sp.]
MDEARSILQREFLAPPFGGKAWSPSHPEAQPKTREEAWATIRGMLEALDEPATRLLEPGQSAALGRELSGAEGTSVGLPELLSLDVDERTRELVVVTPMRETPASRAGLRPHDVLETLDGQPVCGMRLEEAETRLRGAAGTEVALTVRRGARTIPVTLTREHRPSWLRPVQSRVETRDGHAAGYLRLEMFSPGTADEMRAAVAKLRSAGVDRLVLDLRGNPGGLLTEAVDVAGQFLGPKPLALLSGRPERTRTLKAERPQEVDLPLVVLVDEGTASAAELLAGALQAHERAKLVGARTFGKGLVHGLFPLADGSALLVTTGRLVTPKGRDLLAEGVEPDVPVSGELSGDALPGLQDERYAKALDVLEVSAQQQRPPPPR